MARFIFFYCPLYIVIPRPEPSPVLPLLVSYTLFRCFGDGLFDFNQSASISPVSGASFPFSLFLYKVLIDSCSSKCTLNAGGFFLYIVLYILVWLGFACVKNLNLFSTNLWSLSISLPLKTLVSLILLFNLSFIIM